MTNITGLWIFFHVNSVIKYQFSVLKFVMKPENASLSMLPYSLYQLGYPAGFQGHSISGLNSLETK